MRLLEDHELGPMRVRVTDCGCALGEECDTRFVFATTHRQLWLSVGVTSPGDGVETTVRMLLEDEDEDDGDDPSFRELVDIGLALFGLPWEEATRGPEATYAAVMAFNNVPAWMLRVPAPSVWAVRRCVFGRSLTRVPAALHAVHRAFVDEAPAGEELLRVLGRRS